MSKKSASSIADKDKMIHRIRCIAGQLVVVESAVDQEKNCVFLMQALAAARGSLDGILLKVIEEHVRHNLIGSTTDQGEGIGSVAVLTKMVKACLR
jgi:FrmR/RcnR family transcriptional regulator, repressor of rcnA expression